MVKRVWIVALVLVILGASLPVMAPASAQEETWLHAPLIRLGNGDILYLFGPSLKNEAAAGKVYTYFKNGEHITLKWDGYKYGANRWKISEEVKAKHPDWKKNWRWSVDFPVYSKQRERLWWVLGVG